ncbi:MAG: hypothetical protein WBE26_06725 [Phycisphaerae bacterium]
MMSVQTYRNTKSVILTDTAGHKTTYTIMFLRCSPGPGWRVQGDDLDAFVPFGAVGFPTPANIVSKAYEIQTVAPALCVQPGAVVQTHRGGLNDGKYNRICLCGYARRQARHGGF